MDKEKELTGSAGSIVYALDVVNEYLHRQSFARTWTNIYKNSGDSPSYVKKALARFFRYTITKVENLVSVEEELDNCETYFGIQKTLNLVEFINAAKSMG